MIWVRVLGGLMIFFGWLFITSGFNAIAKGDGWVASLTATFIIIYIIVGTYLLTGRF